MSNWFDQDNQEANAERKVAKRKRAQDDDGMSIEAADSDAQNGFFDAQTEDAGEEGGVAEIEYDKKDRDETYDKMNDLGNFVEKVGGGTALTSPDKGAVLIGVGLGIQAGSYVGKGVGEVLDKMADLADDSAHRRHLNGDMKRIERQKDEKALKNINKGMKPGQGVTKDD